MKKIVYSIFLVSIMALPAISACPIGKACSAEDTFNNRLMQPPAIENNYIQNDLNNFRTREVTQPKNLGSSNPIQMPMGLNNPEQIQTPPQVEAPYNASCQFGICLP